MKKTIELTYKQFSNLEYYDTDISESENKFISTVKIDYKKVDTNKMLEINPQLSVLIKNKKIRCYKYV